MSESAERGSAKKPAGGIATPDDVTLELNSVFVGIMRATTKGGEAFTAGFALTPARVAVISILHRHPDRPLTVGEIATGLHVSSTNISRRLDGLERAGWVQRERNPEDGRSIYVSLTDHGRRQAEAIMPVIYRRLDEVWSVFNPEEKRSLLGYLDRFLEHIQSSPNLGPMSGK
jgi:MarR family 2-MHQ and catechol resistance regulon transcriptional repressor